MYRARDAAIGVVLAERLRAAHTHWTQLKGLLGTRDVPRAAVGLPPQAGMPCLSPISVR
jgi:hypothetical protein